MFIALLALLVFLLTFVPALGPGRLANRTPKAVPPPPMTPAAVGTGEMEYGLVVWWRCPGCKRLIGLMEDGRRERGTFRTPFGVYFFDLSPDDRQKTEAYLCALANGGDPWGLLVEFETKGPPAFDDPQGTCPEEVGRYPEVWRGYLGAIGLSWTPALLKRELSSWFLLPPEEETYLAFLKRLGGEGSSDETP